MTRLSRGAFALMASVAISISSPVIAGSKHDHSHDHAHSHDEQIYKGYFEDSQIQPRTLADWEGSWQSIYPLLVDGTLDPVLAHKAEHGEKSAEEYRAYYETGYGTDVDAIKIDGQTVTFTANGESFGGEYVSDGYEVLTYKKGNRGVRFIFKKESGDDKAPAFIQFSDHNIAPKNVSHYHLYWGDDRTKVLEELTNWPTYYPASYSGDDIVHEMIAH